MRQIHYFQRYSSKENRVTNATMLLLSRLNYTDPALFQAVLNHVLNDKNVEIAVGAQFGQQERGKASVADGLIFQNGFNIAIETKLTNDFSSVQLENHLQLLSAKSGKKILLGLSKWPVPAEINEQVLRAIEKDEYKDIQFASVTFSFIIEMIQEILPDYQFQMIEILGDYIAFCNEENLTNIEQHTMLAVTSSTSHDMNWKYNLYYDPATRNHNIPFTYIGLYNNKEVVGIGHVEKVVCCDLIDGQLIIKDGTYLTQEEKDRVRKTIEETSDYNLTVGNKFYLVDKFIPTSFPMHSKSSLRAKQYIFFTRYKTYQMSFTIEQIAEWLKQQTW